MKRASEIGVKYDTKLAKYSSVADQAESGMNAFVLGLAFTLAAPAPKETPKEAPKIEGEWIVESFDGDGEKGPDGSVLFLFTDTKVTTKEGKRDKAEEAGYTVDLKKKPATIDIRPGRPGGKEEIVLGIIEVKGDVMKLCFTKEGGERPTEFKGNKDKRTAMITLKRVKLAK